MKFRLSWSTFELEVEVAPKIVGLTLSALFPLLTAYLSSL